MVNEQDGSGVAFVWSQNLTLWRGLLILDLSIFEE